LVSGPPQLSFFSITQTTGYATGHNQPIFCFLSVWSRKSEILQCTPLRFKMSTIRNTFGNLPGKGLLEASYSLWIKRIQPWNNACALCLFA